MARSVFGGVAWSVACLCFTLLSCTDQGEEPPAPPRISSDLELFRHVAQVDPLTFYTLFPDVDSLTSGTLNGSNAHQPLVRVSMNARAISALQSDTLPAGAAFPDSAVILKHIISNGQTELLAVILKDRGNPLAAGGWLWAEFYPDGTPYISVTRGGVNCIGCHSREQGPGNDFVRTFERQH